MPTGMLVIAKAIPALHSRLGLPAALNAFVAVGNDAEADISHKERQKYRKTDREDTSINITFEFLQFTGKRHYLHPQRTSETWLQDNNPDVQKPMMFTV